MLQYSKILHSNDDVYFKNFIICHIYMNLLWLINMVLANAISFVFLTFLWKIHFLTSWYDLIFSNKNIRHFELSVYPLVQEHLHFFFMPSDLLSGLHIKIIVRVPSAMKKIDFFIQENSPSHAVYKKQQMLQSEINSDESEITLLNKNIYFSE